MSSVRISLVTIALVAAPALAACGEEEEARRAAARTPAPTPAATQAALPVGLAGTWRVGLKRGELPDDAHEVKGEIVDDFELEFHATGGIQDGPSMTLVNEALETSVIPVRLSADEIVIEEFVDCRKLTYAVEGDRLTIQSPAGCVRRHTLPAILATRPWRRIR